MALPYAARTTFDVTVNLNTTGATRNFEGATYSGKHVKVIGKTGSIDTGSTLIFNGCASVTIEGGYFQPTVRNQYGGVGGTGGVGPGTLTFNTVGAVHLEGVVIDNSAIFDDGGDAVYVTAKTALTTVTMQNCNFMNVRGLQSNANAHGDIFQTGSTNMGKCGPVRVYNCTFSGNYQGFYMNPQSGGGMTSAAMERVNIKRTDATVNPGARLIYLFQPGSVYDGTDGYPASFTDVYVKGGASETVLDCIWPSNFTGSGNWFPTDKYWAVRSSEVVNGVTRFYATYPKLTDAGKVVSGKIYEGDPAEGDYAPTAKIGFNNYKLGTDISTPVIGPDVPGDPWIAQPNGNLLLQQNWTRSGSGTISINGPTGQVSIAASGSRTSVSQVIPTEVGETYRLSFHTNTADSIASPVGSSSTTLSDYVTDTLKTPAPGDFAASFTATSTSAYISLTRTSTASPSASSIIFEKMPAGSTLSRRLDGLSQYFTLDVSASGLRTANYNWFIGGWFKFTYMPTTTAYIMDFGDVSASGGTARNRLAWDAALGKLFCSSSAQDGTSYRECGFVTALARDVWYHVGMLCPPGGDVQLYLNGAAVGTNTGAQPTPSSETICKRLTLGARSGTTITNYNPARYADWTWWSNAVPTGAQITALAAKTRPNAITGTAPTYWWAFDQTSTTEPSLGAAATLTATGAPTTVLGPVVTVTTPVVVRRPLDFILI